MADIPVAIQIQTSTTGVENLDVITKKILQLKAALSRDIGAGMRVISQTLTDLQSFSSTAVSRPSVDFVKQYGLDELQQMLPRFRKELDASGITVDKWATLTKDELADAISSAAISLDQLDPSLAEFNKMVYTGKTVTASHVEQLLQLAYGVKLNIPIYTLYKNEIDRVIIGLEQMNIQIAKNTELQKMAAPVHQFGTQKTAAAAAALREVASAAQGALMATSLFQGSFMGLAFGLIFLQFSMHNISLTSFLLGTGLMALAGIVKNLTKFITTFGTTVSGVSREIGRLEASVSKLWMKFGKEFVKPIAGEMGGLVKSVRELSENFMGFFNNAVKGLGVSKMFGLIMQDLSFIIQELGPILKVTAVTLVIALQAILAPIKLITGFFARFGMLMKWAADNSYPLWVALKGLSYAVAFLANTIIFALIAKGLVGLVKWLGIMISKIWLAVFGTKAHTKTIATNTVTIRANTLTTTANSFATSANTNIKKIATSVIRALGMAYIFLTTTMWASLAPIVAANLLWIAIGLAVISVIAIIIIFRKKIGETIGSIGSAIKEFFAGGGWKALFGLKKEDVKTDENQRIMKASLVPDAAAIKDGISWAGFDIRSSMALTFFSPFVDDIYNNLTTKSNEAFAKIDEGIRNALSAEMWAALGKDILDWAKTSLYDPFVTAIKDKFVTPIKTVINTIRHLFTTLLGSEFWSAIGHNMSVWIQQSFIAPIISKFAGFLEHIKTILEAIGNISITDNQGKVWRPFASALGASWGVQQKINELNNKLAGIEALRPVEVPSLLPQQPVPTFGTNQSLQDVMDRSDEEFRRPINITVNINGNVIDEKKIKDLATEGVDDAVGRIMNSVVRFPTG